MLRRGQASISDLVLELGTTTDQVKAWIYDLVGKGLFSGYINWKDGILYSKQAGAIRETKKCPNCGGQMEFGGKGVIPGRIAARTCFWRRDRAARLRVPSM